MSNELRPNPLAKGLIFDIDGTICDTMPVHFIAWRQTAAEHGIDFTPELFVEVTGVPAFQTKSTFQTNVCLRTSWSSGNTMGVNQEEPKFPNRPRPSRKVPTNGDSALGMSR